MVTAFLSNVQATTEATQCMSPFCKLFRGVDFHPEFVAIKVLRIYLLVSICYIIVALKGDRCSVHNQRIERLWRDMHRCVTGTLYRLFNFLEHHNMLDPINEAHLCALHYIFLPRINQSLMHFQESWNHHPVSTER